MLYEVITKRSPLGKKGEDGHRGKNRLGVGRDDAEKDAQRPGAVNAGRFLLV